MSQNSRTTARPRRQSHSANHLLERLHSQFPELSRDEVSRAAAGVAALPGIDVSEPIKTSDHPPRHRA